MTDPSGESVPATERSDRARAVGRMLARTRKTVRITRGQAEHIRQGLSQMSCSRCGARCDGQYCWCGPECYTPRLGHIGRDEATDDR